MGGRRRRRRRDGGGVGVRREEEKPPQVKTRGQKLPKVGPDHSTRPQGPMCRSWFYKVVNPPYRKADHLSLATGDMVIGVDSYNN